MKLHRTSLAFAIASFAAPACGAGPAAPSGSAPGVPATSSTDVSDRDCPARYLVDDAEDDNNQVLVREGRSGYWYTFVDRVGSSITPPAQITFLMSPGGAARSKYAPRMMGKLATSGQPLFAG